MTFVKRAVPGKMIVGSQPELPQTGRGSEFGGRFQQRSANSETHEVAADRELGEVGAAVLASHGGKPDGTAGLARGDQRRAGGEAFLPAAPLGRREFVIVRKIE